MENLYADIAKRTGGNIYIGVVGPVRTGKSTLIKRIMEELVIPNIRDPYRAERARDELPQSGSGRTIMTSEPKFVPEEAIEISPDGATQMRIRMIDSVGYMVRGAVGAEEEGMPRMVATPWYDHEIPLSEAAELGTKKVMEEHCSIGLLVTTDGSITDIPRQDYAEAEARAIGDMQATGKPFLVIINSRQPDSEEAKALKEKLEGEYGIHALCADCQTLDPGGILEVLKQLLYSFPLRQLQVYMPKWMDALEGEHPVKTALYKALLETAGDIRTLADAHGLSQLPEKTAAESVSVTGTDLGTGKVECVIRFPEALYYEVLSSKAGLQISSDAQLLELLTELSAIRREYEKISDALASVKATGYGIVMPTAEEMTLEAPELTKRNGSYGVSLRAAAPSIHMIRVDIDTQITPTVGDEQQSRALIADLGDAEAEKLWQSNIFGKSVYDLIQEGLVSKLLRMPEDVRGKFRGTLTRIVNDGANGLFCLII